MGQEELAEGMKREGARTDLKDVMGETAEDFAAEMKATNLEVSVNQTKSGSAISTNDVDCTVNDEAEPMLDMHACELMPSPSMASRHG
jgi:hypothetical protein